MDQDVEEAAERVQNEWEKATSDLVEKIQAVETCGSVGGLPAKAAVPQGSTSLHNFAISTSTHGSDIPTASERGVNFRSLTFGVWLVCSEEMGEACVQKVQEWKNQVNEFRLSLRNANRNAKLNIERAAKRERELLLAGGEQATIRRRNLQTQAGMVAGAESITDGLRRTRQMMVQEVERTANTIQTLDQSNTTLLIAKEEYHGARSILNRTRHLLSTMSRSDLIDRAILVVGITVFLLVCNYIFLKRLGIWRAQRSTYLPIYSTHVPMYETTPRVLSTPTPVDVHVVPINDEL